MHCFSKHISHGCTRDLTRPTVKVSGVALFLTVAIAGVGEDNTNARNLTVVRIELARATIDFTIGGF